VTAYATTNQLATVQQLDGNALPEAVAAGDWVWRVSQDGTTRNGSPLAIAGAEMDLVDAPNATAIQAITDGVLDDALSGHTTAGTVGKAVADIETKAGSLTFTVANELDVNVKSQNDGEVFGAGTSADKWRGEE
jgi:hypothetical protein